MAADVRVGRLDEIVEHGHDTRSLFFALAEPLVFRPGQFVSCLLPVDGGEIIRPYSIASSPEEPTRIELLLNLVPGGPGSHHLFSLLVGAALRFTGPWGTFCCDAAPPAEAVFIAEGPGIAPIRPMLRRVLASPTAQAVRLLYATDHAVYGDELARLPGLHVTRVAPGTLEAEVHRRWIDADDDRTRRFFICGVGAIVTTLRDRLRRAGYERRAVQYEKW
jgi:ferredoxin-NADP reductase